VRFVNITKTRAGPAKRLASCFSRRRGDSMAALPLEQLGSFCFGPVGKRDELALTDFVAGQEPSVGGRPLERPHRDGTDPTG
jgi:hypothetical protein